MSEKHKRVCKCTLQSTKASVPRITAAGAHVSEAIKGYYFFRPSVPHLDQTRQSCALNITSGASWRPKFQTTPSNAMRRCGRNFWLCPRGQCIPGACSLQATELVAAHSRTGSGHRPIGWLMFRDTKSGFFASGSSQNDCERHAVVCELMSHDAAGTLARICLT
eukprot:6179209-Pleurochrysis_carterae.AAC.2